MRSVALKKYALLAGIASVWYGLDLASKQWALTSLKQPLDVIGPFRFNLIYNDGSAFGLAGDYGRWIGLLSVLFIVGAVFAVRWLNGYLPVALAGITVGGAAGNLSDRIFRADDGIFSGSVIDFIDLTWWPIFNVADIGIVVGLAGFVVLVMKEHSRQAAEAKSEVAGAQVEQSQSQTQTQTQT